MCIIQKKLRYCEFTGSKNMCIIQIKLRFYLFIDLKKTIAVLLESMLERINHLETKVNLGVNGSSNISIFNNSRPKYILKAEGKLIFLLIFTLCIKYPPPPPFTTPTLTPYASHGVRGGHEVLSISVSPLTHSANLCTMLGTIKGRSSTILDISTFSVMELCPC